MHFNLSSENGLGLNELKHHHFNLPVRVFLSAILAIENGLHNFATQLIKQMAKSYDGNDFSESNSSLWIKIVTRYWCYSARQCFWEPILRQNVSVRNIPLSDWIDMNLRDSTNSIWSRGQQVRSLRSMQPLMYTTNLVWSCLNYADFIWTATPNKQNL